MWKYIKGDKISEATARNHFGCKDPACPVVELANGMFAAWLAAPLGKPSEYPPLSFPAKSRELGFASVSQ